MPCLRRADHKNGRRPLAGKLVADIFLRFTPPFKGFSEKNYLLKEIHFTKLVNVMTSVDETVLWKSKPANLDGRIT